MTDAVETQAPAVAGKAPKVPKRGIGMVIKEAIMAGKTNEEALALALEEFPQAHTSASTVSWYRNKLRKDGTIDVPTARSLKRAAEAVKLAEAAKLVEAAKPAEAAAAVDPLA
jgi:hypothetical protein